VKLGLAVAFSGLIICALLLIGCGQTYELSSLEITPSSPNVVGIGGTQQMTVTARYTNEKTQDVTVRSTFTIAAPNGTILVVPQSAFTINANGMIEVVQGACTWTKTGTTAAPVYGTTPYILKASFDKHDAIAFVSVASVAGCEYPK
jgi:hypothetical protein